MKENKKHFKQTVIILLGCLIIIPSLWLATKKLEGEKPSINLERSSFSFGKSQTLTGTVTDLKSGIRKLWIGIIKDGRETVLLEKEYPAGGLWPPGSGKVHKEAISIDFEPQTIGISDGKAILRITVRDYAWRNWWHGNLTYIEKEVVIDTIPPELEILSEHLNVAQGGAGLVIYKISEAGSRSAILIGENEFPGHSGYFSDANVYLAYIAMHHGQGPETKIYVTASDPAGNSTKVAIACHIRRKRFRKDTINISEAFINRKLPEFEKGAGYGPKNSPVERFLAVNRNIRRANMETFVKMGKKTDKVQYWEGKFLRLPKSETRAGFADYRSYKYAGRVIDRQVHMGVDLASVKKSPVPAANSGKVVLVGDLGIYGKTVLIDHGFSLFSSYSHLSHVDVTSGQMVIKGQPVGVTGKTGLAGGDHLHFGIMVHHTFVDPLEWWDAAWIGNNITDKLKKIESIQ